MWKWNNRESERKEKQETISLMQINKFSSFFCVFFFVCGILTGKKSRNGKLIFVPRMGNWMDVKWDA